MVSKLKITTQNPIQILKFYIRPQQYFSNISRLNGNTLVYYDLFSCPFPLNISRYEVSPDYVENLAAGGLKFVATNEDGTRMEAFDFDEHPYFVGVQYHPEYLTRPLKPSPPYLGLLLACTSQFDLYPF